MPPDRRPFGPGPYLRGARLRSTTDDFPFGLPAVREIARLRFDAPVTFLVGENGTGKSTIVEGLAAALHYDLLGGERPGMRRRVDDPLGDALELEEGRCKPRTGFFLRAESFFGVASGLDSAIYGDRALTEQSHGESFIALAANRFGADGLYLLDEPEAPLSVTSQLALLTVMARAARSGSQLIVATHSPILLSLPGARIYELGEGGIREIAWEDAEPVRLTKGFLDAPERWLREVLEDDGLR